MEEISDRVLAEVKALTQVVGGFDVSLCTKANKQELLGVDNRFRQYVKLALHEPFVETTELEMHDMKTEVNSLVEKLDVLVKNLSNDIH